MFATDRSMRIDHLARAAEERGLESLYVPEHTHIPISRRTPPPTGDEVLADEYKRTVDPLVALAAAAVVTQTVRLGTGICLVAQREPIVTAKAIATLDALSGGRFVFGIGFGWNRDEMEHHRVDPKRRREQAREHVLAMKALWSHDVASFDSEFVRFEPSWSWPKPARAGGPPILLGGAAVRAALPDLHRACDAAGRDPATIRIVPFGTVPDPGKLEYYASIGIDEVVLRIPSATADRVLPVLDEYAGLVGARGGSSVGRHALAMVVPRARVAGAPRLRAQ